jgi:GNAT superfamily N-acetyltransferase
MDIGSMAAGAKVRYDKDHWSCRSTVGHPIGNFAIHFQGGLLPMKPVKEALRNATFRLYTLTGDTPRDLEGRLLSIGLRHRYELVGMAVESMPAAERCQISAAGSAPEALEAARFIAATFFWRSNRIVREELAAIMAASYPNHEFFWLRDRFGIAAAGTLTLDAEVIGLYNLCVRPDLRSQGIGTSVFAELIHLAAERAPHVALMCDPELVPWYAQRGCTPVGKLQAFSA